MLAGTSANHVNKTPINFVAILAIIATSIHAAQPAAWTHTTSNMSFDEGTGLLWKSSGGSDWNGGAQSTRSTTEGNCALEFGAHQTGKARMIGLAVNPSGHIFGNIDYTLYLNGSSSYMVYEKGNNKTGYATFAADDSFRIAFEEGDVVYTHIRATGEEVEVRRVPGGAKYPIYADVSINYPQGAFSNVTFGALMPAAPSITAYEVADPNAGDDVFNAGDTLTIRFDQATDGSGSDLNKDAVDDLFDFDPEIGTDYSGSWTDEQTFVVIILDPGTAVLNRANATVTPAGTTGIRLASTPAGTASTAESPGLTGYFGGRPITWGTHTNITVDGASLTKSGSSDWNGVATSNLPVLYAPGDAYVEFTVSEATSNRMIGFADFANNGQFSGLDGSLFLNALGRLHVYKYGAYVADIGSYAVGDVLRLAVSAIGEFIIFQNDTEIHRLSGVLNAGHFPLYMRAAMDTFAGTFTDVRVCLPPVPSAANDVIVAGEDETLVLPAPGVLGNDGYHPSLVATVSDAAEAASYGVTVAADGSLPLDPAAEFNGEFTISYTISSPDFIITDSAATVTITVVAVLPRLKQELLDKFVAHCRENYTNKKAEGFPCDGSFERLGETEWIAKYCALFVEKTLRIEGPVFHHSESRIYPLRAVFTEQLDDGRQIHNYVENYYYDRLRKKWGRYMMTLEREIKYLKAIRAGGTY